MNKIIKCQHCGADISDTAIKCAICFKETGSSEVLREKMGLSTAIALTIGGGATLLLAPVAGLLGGVLGGLSELFKKHELKELAKKHCAIDFFPLGDEDKVLVIKDKFVILVSIAGAQYLDLTQIMRSDIRNAYIDESKHKDAAFLSTEKNTLVLEYFDDNTNKVELWDSEYSGNNSRALAEYSCIKFLEYKL